MAYAGAVVIGAEQFPVLPERPFVFGRADTEGIVGLDADDMGISAEAGSVQHDRGLWWVVNRSRKRPLFLDGGGGGALQQLECGRGHAISVARLSVLVPGSIYTHRLEVVVPVEDVPCFEAARPPSDTITGELHLSEHDRDVVVALLSGYLQDFLAERLALGPTSRQPTSSGHPGLRRQCGSRLSDLSSASLAAACT